MNQCVSRHHVEVPYIDDTGEGPILLGGIDCIDCASMATALAHIFSDDGFVIAADGRNTIRTLEGPRIVSDHEQKVFRLPGAERDVACAFSGMVTLLDDAGNIAFNFMSECIRAAETISSVPLADAFELAAKLGELVQQKLIAARDSGTLSRYPAAEPPQLGERGNTIVRIYLDGYFKGYPFRAGMRLYHEDQQVAWGTTPHDLHRLHKAVLRGSSEIAGLLFDSADARLGKYRTEAFGRVAARYRNPDSPVTLQDALDVARNYIAACSDPIAIEIDRANCQGIGGLLHIAAITPKDGFYWVEPPAGE